MNLSQLPEWKRMTPRSDSDNGQGDTMLSSMNGDTDVSHREEQRGFSPYEIVWKPLGCMERWNHQSIYCIHRFLGPIDGG